MNAIRSRAVDTIPRPPHAYVPGQTPRHPEGRFDGLREDLDTAWRAGCLYLSEGYFWEAHELLEPVWMAEYEGSDARQLVQALIQVANAGLKVRMNRPRAVDRLLKLAGDALAGLEGQVKGVPIVVLRGLLDQAQTNQGDLCIIMQKCSAIGATTFNLTDNEG